MFYVSRRHLRCRIPQQRCLFNITACTHWILRTDAKGNTNTGMCHAAMSHWSGVQWFPQPLPAVQVFKYCSLNTPMKLSDTPLTSEAGPEPGQDQTGARTASGSSSFYTNMRDNQTLSMTMSERQNTSWHHYSQSNTENMLWLTLCSAHYGVL